MNLCDLWRHFWTPSNVASLTSTILGVFIGFILSYWQYNRRKRKEQNHLNLEYVKLIKNELTRNLDCLQGAIGNLPKCLGDHKDGSSQEAASQMKSALRKTVYYLVGSVTDMGLKSAVSIGATRPAFIKVVSEAYQRLRVVITNAMPHVNAIDSGLCYEGDEVPIYKKILGEIRDELEQLVPVLKHAIEELECLERELQ